MNKPIVLLGRFDRFFIDPHIGAPPIVPPMIIELPTSGIVRTAGFSAFSGWTKECLLAALGAFASATGPDDLVGGRKGQIMRPVSRALVQRKTVVMVQGILYQRQPVLFDLRSTHGPPALLACFVERRQQYRHQ